MFGEFALRKFKELNNGISNTQRAALESGTVGYEASIFSGKPDWNGLLSTETPGLSDEEKSFLGHEVEDLCRMIDDWKIRNELHDMPDEIWDFLKKNRFFGIVIPKEYGGRGFSAQGHSAVIAKIASRSGTVAANTMVPNSLGPAELLVRYGTKEQKDMYLPRLADGREVPCFSLTGPQAGSDATNQKDDGVVFRNKEDGKLYLRLNWDKRYITLAPVATLFGVAFNLKDPHHLLGDKEDMGITLALIPAETPGIDRGQRHRPSGTPFQCGPHWGKDVIVPIDRIIGGPEKAGKGWNMLVDCLSVGRSVSLPASAAGSARLAARAVGAYSFVRNQFGMPLSKMEGVQEALARIGGLTYMIDAARVLPLQDIDLAHKSGRDARPAVASAILKYHTTEAARRIAIDSMDIFAGKAVCDGPSNPVGILYQGAPVGITVEGANILTRSMMIFGQGAFLAHPFTLKELQAAKDNDAKAAGKLLRGHLGNIFNNAARSVWLGLTNGRGSTAPRSGPDKEIYQQINRLSSAYAYAANMMMLSMQGSLARRERISALLGDVYANLYLASQVLRRFDYEGRHKEDEPLMQWAGGHCLYQAEQALHEVIENYPGKLMRAFLKPVIFPRGTLLEKPSHRLDKAVAEAMSTPGPARERLTAGMFLPTGSADYMARLENAFSLAHEAYPYEQILQKKARSGDLSQPDNRAAMIEEAVSKGYIDNRTADLLIESDRARNDVIAVDSFPGWDGPARQGPR
jgi:alkylation response protein AidB-like acyl-CoA dehydrogenase